MIKLAKCNRSPAPRSKCKHRGVNSHGSMHLREVAVVQAAHDDAVAAEAAGQQRAPRLVPNDPGPAYSVRQSCTSMVKPYSSR